MMEKRGDDEKNESEQLRFDYFSLLINLIERLDDLIVCPRCLLEIYCNS